MVFDGELKEVEERKESLHEHPMKPENNRNVLSIITARFRQNWWKKILDFTRVSGLCCIPSELFAIFGVLGAFIPNCQPLLFVGGWP